ncbi:MAG: hypothetical protein R3B93_07375 [Bacteroidia bacterium]
MTGVSFTASLIIGTFVVTLYTFFGGMWAVSVTDFIQCIVIIIGLICLAVFWSEEAGGFMTVINSPPAGHYRFFPESTTLSWLDWFSAWAVLGLGSIGFRDIFQRANPAPSEKAAIVLLISRQ